MANNQSTFSQATFSNLLATHQHHIDTTIRALHSEASSLEENRQMQAQRNAPKNVFQVPKRIGARIQTFNSTATASNSTSTTIPISASIDWSGIDENELKKLRGATLEEGEENASAVASNLKRGSKMLEEAVNIYHRIVCGDKYDVYGVQSKRLSTTMQQKLAKDASDSMVGHLLSEF